MKNFMNYLKDEDGQALTEYGLILALVAVVIIVVLAALGDQIKAVFQRIIDALTPSSTTSSAHTFL